MVNLYTFGKIEYLTCFRLPFDLNRTTGIKRLRTKFVLKITHYKTSIILVSLKIGVYTQSYFNTNSKVLLIKKRIRSLFCLFIGMMEWDTRPKKDEMGAHEGPRTELRLQGLDLRMLWILSPPEENQTISVQDPVILTISCLRLNHEDLLFKIIG